MWLWAVLAIAAMEGATTCGAGTSKVALFADTPAPSASPTASETPSESSSPSPSESPTPSLTVEPSAPQPLEDLCPLGLGRQGSIPSTEGGKTLLFATKSGQTVTVRSRPLVDGKDTVLLSYKEESAA